MECILKKIGNNSISINAAGFEPTICSYEEFFTKEILLSNKYCYVDSYAYENGVITFNKIDKRFGNVYYDRYQISQELQEDEQFMTKLDLFLDTYASQIDDLNKEANEKMDDYYYARMVSRIAKDVYKTYRATGIIKPIYWDEIKCRVINLYKNHQDEIRANIDNDYGCVEYEEYEDTAAKIGRVVGYGSVLLGFLTTLGLGLTANSEVPLDIINQLTGGAVSMSVFGGIAIHITKTRNKKKARTVMLELAQRLEYEQNILELINGPIISQEKLTLTP